MVLEVLLVVRFWEGATTESYRAKTFLISMIVTRQCDIGRYTWTSSKIGDLHQTPSSPRMSNFEQLSAQQDWQEQYSQYLSQSEDTISSPQYEQAPGLDSADGPTIQDQSLTTRPQVEHRNSFGRLEGQQNAVQIGANDRPGSAPENRRQQASNGLGHDHLDPADPKDHSAAAGTQNSTSPSLQEKRDTSIGPAEDVKQEDIKEGLEDYDDDDDDDEMLDPEDGAGAPQTEAERRAERRKMKRFR